MKKRIIIFGIIALIAIIIAALVFLPGTWSTRSFEAIVHEGAKEQDGIISLTVEKTTEFYGDPLCTL